MFISIKNVVVNNPTVENFFRLTEDKESVLLDAKIVCVVMSSIKFTKTRFQSFFCKNFNGNQSKFDFFKSECANKIFSTYVVSLDAREISLLKIKITLICTEFLIKQEIEIPLEIPQILKLAGDYRLEISPQLKASLKLI